ncbi:MAG: cytochrome c oxidase subunit II [bacterium]|nr:cytochrome c oxidase subunit II [bacterium]MDI1336766.1 cytochrome c oxidase subunit II [Lacunisphaera sp.]
MTRPRLVHRNILRLVTASFAGLSLALLSGCKLVDAVHQIFSLSGPQSTMVTAGPVAKSQWDLFMVTVYVTTFIFIVVGAVLAYAQIKFRAKSEADEHAEPPPQGHGNPFVEIGLIAASVFLLVIIAIPTLKGIWYTHDVPDEDKANAIDVTATGYQWWFKFEYPTEMVKLPGGAGEAPLVTGNELVVPAGVPVRVQLRTVDVIHSFWIPKLAGKVDMMPNRGNFLWFKADHPGYFYGQCAEYCGESHAIMRFRVIALSAPDYAKWLENQKQAARTVTASSLAAAAAAPTVQFASMKFDAGAALSGSPQFDADPLGAWKAMQKPEAGENAALIATGRKLFNEKTCVKCHMVRGHEGIGITGPDLTRVGARSTIAAGVLENTQDLMHKWIKDPEYFKPGNKMFHGIGGMTGYMAPNDKGDLVPNIILNDTEITALVAYLHSLK